MTHQHVAMRTIDDAGRARRPRSPALTPQSGPPLLPPGSGRGRRRASRSGAVALTATARAAGAQATTHHRAHHDGRSPRTARSTAPRRPTTTTTLPPSSRRPRISSCWPTASRSSWRRSSSTSWPWRPTPSATTSCPVIAAFTSHHQQHAQAYAGLAGEAAAQRRQPVDRRQVRPRHAPRSDEEAVLTVAFGMRRRRPAPTSAPSPCWRGRTGPPAPPTSCPSRPVTPS